MGLDDQGDSSGIGDMSLYGMYRFFTDEAEDVHLSGILGLKVPTGHTSERTRRGSRFEVEHQPGSGSWDPMAGVAFTREWGHFSIATNVLFVYTTRGSQRTVPGNRFDYNLAASYRFLGDDRVRGEKREPTKIYGLDVDVDLIAEFNGAWEQKLRIRGRKNDNSGGNIIFFSPGLRVQFNDRVSVNGLFLYPIVDNPNGFGQKTDYQAIGGIGVTF